MKDWLKILDVKVSDDQKIWMEELFKKQFADEFVRYRELWVDLLEKINKNFDPNSIDQRLVLSRGTRLTIFGVEYIKPEFGIFNKTDTVIRAIRKKILGDATLKEVTLLELVAETNLEAKEINFILSFIDRFKGEGYFNGSNGDNEFRFKSVSVQDDRSFDAFLKYESLDEILEYELKGDEEEIDLISQKVRYPLSKFSLSGLPSSIDLDDTNGITCYPIFKSAIPKINHKLCFVLMPFTLEWSERVYKQLIRPSIESLGLQCLRADNLTGQIIIEDIWLEINRSAFIIADVTSRNPNVMYEMGIVHTIGKPTILISQDVEKRPFDMAHLRHLEYQDNVSGEKDFSNKINDFVKSIYEQNYPEIQLKM